MSWELTDWGRPVSGYAHTNPEAVRIDAHQHFWKFDPVRDAWIDETMKAIRRDFGPGDLRPLLQANQIDGCVAVQADQSEAETKFLLGLAAENPLIKKVVGWVDLASPNVEERLAYWKSKEKLAGFRHILQAEPPEKMDDKAFRHGIALLKKYAFTYDILIFPRHLEAALRLVDAFPDQPFVVDHLAKPLIRKRQMEPWASMMKQLARRPHVVCKVSGMVTEANLADWQPEDLRPYMDIVVDAFGPARLMFGSDWPVCLLAASYERVCRIVDDYFSNFTDTERAQVMGGTAARFYGITN